MTPGEERLFKNAIQDINDWASPLDLTMPDWMSSGWDDYLFAYCYPAFASRRAVAPSRHDIAYLPRLPIPPGWSRPKRGFMFRKMISTARCNLRPPAKKVRSFAKRIPSMSWDLPHWPQLGAIACGLTRKKCSTLHIRPSFPQSYGTTSFGMVNPAPIWHAQPSRERRS